MAGKKKQKPKKLPAKPRVGALPWRVIVLAEKKKILFVIPGIH